MAELGASFLGPTIEVVTWVAKPIVHQFNYLCCFTNNINSLKDEAKKLDDALEGLEGEVERARDNVQVIVPEVKTWLANSNNIRYEITGILDEATNVENGCLKLGARFYLSKRAKKTTDRTKELQGQTNFKAIFQPGPPAARREVQLRKTYEFESRKKIEEDIMTALRGGDVNMIGIYGMGGLGKTTMAKKIMNRVLKEHVFEEVVIAAVSQNVEKSKIQDEIGGSLGLKLEEEKSQSARVLKLHARLNGTKRILLVLDDVWQRLVLEDFGIPYDSRGCTILLTSQNSNVLRAMEVQQICGMKVLSEEEAWFFFRETVGTCVDDMKLNCIGKKIIKECRGLPIALSCVGAVLKDENDLSIWEDSLRQLSHSDPDIPELITEVYNSLKLSYDFLRSQQAKSLFLLFCLFPEDAHIPLEYLTYICMGLGIFKGIGNLEEANNKMRALTKTFKSLSLLLDSDRRNHVRMHDVVRDVCIFIAKQEGCIGGNDCTWFSSFQLDRGRSEFCIQSRLSNLRLLFLSRKYDSLEEEFEFNNAFLERTRELYVLCIENYSLTTLPHQAQSLGKLNTLILDSCVELKTISVVGQLANLEILICRNCGSIEKLPSEIKALYRLKLLEFTRCRKLQSIGRGIISSLVGLEELKMLFSFNKWEAEDREERENAGLRELEALTNLTCLEMDIEDSALVAESMHLSSKIERFCITTDAEYELPFKFNKEMSLCLRREARLGDWIEKQLLRNTECLDLSGNGANNVDLAKIQDIRWLKLRKCESRKNIVTTSMDDDAIVFPSIEYLELEYLPELQEICDGPISSCSFQNLKKLFLRQLPELKQFYRSSEKNNVPLFTNLSSIYIMNCHHLQNLEQLSIAEKDCLPQLQILHVQRCEMMEQVFLWNEKEEHEDKNNIESRNPHLITTKLPNLKEVWLVSLPNLETFYQGIQGIGFPLLREMMITKCPKLKSIIGSNENLGGSSSADIDDFSSHLFCQREKISLCNLKELRVDWNPFYGHKIHLSLFNGLEVLSIYQCQGSMGLFSSSMAGNLVNLRKLDIKNCDEMVKVIEDAEEVVNVCSSERTTLVFPKLEELQLFYLLKLVSFCEWKCDVELPSLRTVFIMQCHCMKDFTLGHLTTPKLKRIRLDLRDYSAAKDLNGAVQQHYLF